MNLANNFDAEVFLEGAAMLDKQFHSDFCPIPLPGYQRQKVAEMRRSVQEFHEMVSRRHTVRDFSDQPVPRDIIEQCLSLIHI